MNHLNKVLLAIMCANTHAASGPFFAITESGAPTSTPVNITICLNAAARLSCQTFDVSTLALSIKTTIPNRTYSTVGLRVNTPGYAIASGAICMPLANGYCQFSTSNTTPSAIDLNGDTAPFLYIPTSTGPSNGYIEQALVESNGAFSSYATTPTSTPDWFPSGIAFATANGTTRAYVSSSGLTLGVFMCELSPDGNGTLSNCTPTTNVQNYIQPRGIAFATSNSVQYAYIPDYEVDSNLAVRKCTLNADGTLGSCGNTPADPGNVVWSNPSAIAFATAGSTQYAYVTDADNTNSYAAVYQCSVDTNGALSNCTSTGNIPASIGNYNAANGIAFATYHEATFAYVTTPLNGIVYQCSWNTDTGNLSSCVDAYPSKHDWTLKGIAFGTVNGVQYAYVSDSGPARAVWKCTVHTDTGLFDTCTKSPASTSPSDTTPWWVNGSVAMYPASS